MTGPLVIGFSVHIPLMVPSLSVFVQVCPRKGHSRDLRAFCAAGD